MKSASKKKSTVARRIVLAVVALILIGVLVAANLIINYYSLIINRFFAGDTATGGGETQGALAFADGVVQDSAAESMVLLENKENYLPKPDLEKVNFFGWGSTDYGLLLTGGGSGGTSITDEKDIKVDLTDAFKADGVQFNEELNKAYEDFSKFDADWRSNGSTNANVVESLLNPPATFYTDERMQSAYRYSPVAVAVLSRWGAENGGGEELVNIRKAGRNYNNGAILELTEEEKAMFDALQKQNFEVIVLLNLCNNMELGFLKEYSCVRACLYMGIPGQSGTSVVPKILKGEIDPSGKTADTFAYDYQTYNPVYLNPYNVREGLVYQEGIYFGYKWYETADADGYFDGVETAYGKGYDGVVQYPFGYGLSYTTFDWEVVSWPEPALADGKTYQVTVKVTNTGSVAGKDVVELYGHAPYYEEKIEKAERVLLDFAKTPLLYPAGQADGEHPNSCEVTLSFTAYDLASYDDKDRNGNKFMGYELDPDSKEDGYEIYVMRNAHAKEASMTFRMSLSSNLRLETDPVTGQKVGNLFTGDTAYAKCPIDGGVTYLSRTNKFANFPTDRAKINAPNADAAHSYRYTGYDGADTEDYEYGGNGDLYLVQAESTDADGNTSLTPPTIEMLSGADKSVNLVFNKDILELLVDYDDPYGLWVTILGQMTRDEVKGLIGNGGFQTIAVASIGKPRCMDKDGPAGFNNNVTNPGKSSVYPLFPSESLLGCSWSREINAKIGEAQAKVGKEYGINGWYGPGVNLHRSVYNSRNYEYYSEDAVLSGNLAAATVAAAREGNLYCYVKHFAISEAGQNPKNVDTWVTEQALRESYLRAFEIPVKEGKTVGIMSAFNCVGAVLSGYNHALLTDILRTEWGFRGSVITDWFEGSGYMSNYTLGVLAGNDLWLAGTTEQPASLDLNDPAVAYAARQSVKNILYTYVATNVSSTTITVNPEAHSWLVDLMQIGVNVLLGGGALVCVVFAVLPSRKNKKEKKAKAKK